MLVSKAVWGGAARRLAFFFFFSFSHEKIDSASQAMGAGHTFISYGEMKFYDDAFGGGGAVWRWGGRGLISGPYGGCSA